MRSSGSRAGSSRSTGKEGSGVDEGPARDPRAPTDESPADGERVLAGNESALAGDGTRYSPDAGAPNHDDLVVSPFPHPPWTVGLVLVGGVITLLFGLLVSPIWLLVGSPFVLALLLWMYVRLFAYD
jgi:hypothetical protein